LGPSTLTTTKRLRDDTINIADSDEEPEDIEQDILDQIFSNPPSPGSDSSFRKTAYSMTRKKAKLMSPEVDDNEEEDTGGSGQGGTAAENDEEEEEEEEDEDEEEEEEEEVPPGTSWKYNACGRALIWL
jgi:hypothetical protein